MGLLTPKGRPHLEATWAELASVAVLEQGEG